MSLCLAAAGIAVQVAASSFTLSWTHTIEKTLWEEDWTIEARRLVLVEARVKGSGAGMEPPANAVLRNGFYAWRLDLPSQEAVTLRRSAQAGDWRLCAAGRCAPLADWLGAEADPVTLHACPEQG